MAAGDAIDNAAALLDHPAQSSAPPGRPPPESALIGDDDSQVAGALRRHPTQGHHQRR